MIGSAAAWRRMLKIWLPGLGLLILNMAVLSTYRFLLAGQAQMRVSRVERLTAELDGLQRHHLALMDVLARAEINRVRVDEFYQRWLLSEAQRLTRVIAEVKSIAGRSRVKTSGYRYPDEMIEEYGLVRRSIVFSAEGSYKSLRQFIHSLEHSDEFLILEEIGVSEGGDDGANIRVSFKVSTLFVSRERSDRA